MIGDDDEDGEDEDEDDGDAEWKDIGEHYADDSGNEVTPGDVFALEMELNRENKKMMKVCGDFAH